MEEVSRELENPAIWNEPERAQALGKERSSLEKTVNQIRENTDALIDANELLDMAESDNDEDTAEAVIADIEKIAALVDKLEFRRMFGGEWDSANCFVDIQSGAGGTEAQDWSEILLRMYLRWCESRGWKTEIMEASDGDVAGIKGATFRVEGEYAFGWLKTEIGVHRLVRKSPFDSDNRRHTSFASVFVSPEVDDTIQIDINPADLRTDVYRSSGAGGQHVNKTESAVRITHIPTGIVAECQDDRSQHRNKARALQVLSARIQEKDRAERAARDAAQRKGLIGTGDRSDRIRTYNFPQGRLTDHRINLTLYKLLTIMEGDLEDVVQALKAAEAAEQLAALEVGAA